MIITMVFDGLATGGITKVGADYADLFVKNGYQVNIINLIPSKQDMHDAFNKECKFYSFFYPRGLVYQRFSPLCVLGPCGVIIYGLLCILLSLVSGFYKVLCRIKLQSLSNTDFLIAFSGHYNDLSFVAKNFVKNKEKIGWLHGTEFEYKIISDGFFDLFRIIKHLVCLSDSCEVTCRKFNKKHGISIKKIYNPINLERMSISKEKVDDLKNRFGSFALMVGRLGTDKDQETAIKAVKIYNQRNQDKLKLLLVGDGPRRNEIELFIEKEGMTDSVFLMGTCQDVQNYYSSATVFVHSSPLEGLPTVLLEAMYYGVPIAATDSFPGVREILGDEKYGLISPIYDPERLAQNIEKLLSDDELRDKYILNGKKRILDFNPQIAFNSINDFMSSIGEKHKNGPNEHVSM